MPARCVALVAAVALAAGVGGCGARHTHPAPTTPAAAGLLNNVSVAELMDAIAEAKLPALNARDTTSSACPTAGCLEAIGLFCQMHALPLTQVSYVIAVKRLSIIFGVLLGAAVFREPDLAHRLPGAAVMVVGVFFIAVFG